MFAVCQCWTEIWIHTDRSVQCNETFFSVVNSQSNRGSQLSSLQLNFYSQSSLKFILLFNNYVDNAEFWIALERKLHATLWLLLPYSLSSVG